MTEAIESRNKLMAILMDIEMPIMDGLKASRIIREKEREMCKKQGHDCRSEQTCPLRTPIIAVTGNARKEYVKCALDAGMDNYIVKPFLVEDLVKILSTYGRHSIPSPAKETIL